MLTIEGLGLGKYQMLRIIYNLTLTCSLCVCVCVCVCTYVVRARGLPDVAAHFHIQ